MLLQGIFLWFLPTLIVCVLPSTFGRSFESLQKRATKSDRRYLNLPESVKRKVIPNNGAQNSSVIIFLCALALSYFIWRYDPLEILLLTYLAILAFVLLANYLEFRSKISSSINKYLRARNKHLKQPVFSKELLASKRYFEGELTKTKQKLIQLDDGRFDQIQKPKLEAEARELREKLGSLDAASKYAPEIDATQKMLFDEIPKNSERMYILISSNYYGFDIVLSGVPIEVVEGSGWDIISNQSALHPIAFIRYDDLKYKLWHAKSLSSFDNFFRPIYFDRTSENENEQISNAGSVEYIGAFSRWELFDQLAKHFDDWFN